MRPKPARLFVAVLAVSVLFLPLWTLFMWERYPPWLHAPLVGSAFVVAGLAMWWKRPENPSGRLSVLVGYLFVIPSLRFTAVPILWTIGAVFDSIFAPALVYLTLAFPRGTLRDRIDRWLLALVVFVTLVPAAVATVFFDPGLAPCPWCRPGMNLILVEFRPDLFPAILNFVNGSILVASLGYSARLIWRYVAATVPRRRILGPVVLPATVWAIAHALSRVIRLVIPTDEAEENTILFSQIVLAMIPFGALVGLLRARARKARIGDLIVELGSAPTSELRSGVARTLGDPDVEVGYWEPSSGVYVTPTGHVLDIPAPESDRAVTTSETDGRAGVAIVHDEALLDEPDLLDAVVAAARLAIENERLQDEVRAQLAEVQASRARIVESSDAVRRRIERDLHDGAQQRLVGLSLQLQLLKENLGGDSGTSQEFIDQALDEAMAALDEIRNLAQGIHPAVLADEGLAAALEFLAERCPIPADVTAPKERYRDAVEATAYFVVSEALTNVTKHADASAVKVVIEREDGTLRVEVVDDGIGGAALDEGTGLRGLADRAAALRGTLRVGDATPTGTRLVAELPCE